MTEKQKQLAAENHKLIFSFLNKHNYDEEEFYDLAAIGLCKAARCYNDSMGAFSTLAYKCMFNEIARYYKLQGAARKIPSNLIGHFDAKVHCEDGYDIGEIWDILDHGNSFEDDLIFELCVETVRKRLTDKDKLVFDMLLEGYTTREIGKAAGCSNVNVTNIRRKMCDKFKGLVNVC